jgi:hypothetical protein
MEYWSVEKNTNPDILPDPYFIQYSITPTLQSTIGFIIDYFGTVLIFLLK